ncbi:MAG TPA: cupin domain-containing protein [Chloroflexia bacterium]|nr:cupin domain-containing protein [Chloroflexia bacterium]
MLAYEIAALLATQALQDRPYHEFLRVPALSMGLYVLPAGAADGQQPHSEDEVYYVVAGRAQIQVDGADRAVQAGSVVFVAAGVPHHFHTIDEALQVLVFFAPAEYTQAAHG